MRVRSVGAAMKPRQAPHVVLIGGSSSTGKTTLARGLAKRLGADHVQVDGLRRGVEDPRVRFLAQTPSPWRLRPSVLCSALRLAAEAMRPVVVEVVDHAVQSARRLVLEGEGLDPSLAARYAGDERVRALFVVEFDRERLARTLLARSASFALLSSAEQGAVVATNALYCRWLETGCRRHGLNCLASQPWATLGDRAERLFTAQEAAD